MKQKSTNPTPKKRIMKKSNLTGNRGKNKESLRNLRPFKKGQSGNPKGRPPKRECITSLLKEAMGKICPQDKQKRTWAEVLTERLLTMASKGDMSALRMVYEYVAGKPTQQAIETPEEVQIVVVYEDQKRYKC